MMCPEVMESRYPHSQGSPDLAINTQWMKPAPSESYWNVDDDRCVVVLQGTS